MSDPRCHHCGQHLPDQNHRPPLEIYSVDEPADPQLAQDAAEMKKPERKARFRWVVPTAIAAACVAMLPSLLGQPVPEVSPAASAVEESATAATTVAEAQRTRDLHADRSLTDLLSSLDSDGAQYGLVYHSYDGIEVVQAQGRTTTNPKAVARFDEVLGYPLLVEGTQSWAINSDDPTETFIAAHNNILVSTAIDGSYVFLSVDDNDIISAGITTQGVSGPLFDLPRGAEILPVQGLGVLYRPETGGTYRIGGLTAELFSEGRVLAATPTAWLEQRCDDGINCDLSVRAENGDSVPVPLDGNATFSLSPDANWLVRLGHSDDIIHLMDLQTGSIVKIPAFGIKEIAWAPDSSFFAWLDGSTLGIYQPAATNLVYQGLLADPYSPSLLITATETSG